MFLILYLLRERETNRWLLQKKSLKISELNTYLEVKYMDRTFVSWLVHVFFPPLLLLLICVNSNDFELEYSYLKIEKG